MMSYVLAKHKPELIALLDICHVSLFFRCNLQQTASLVAPSRIAILCKDQSIALTLKTDGKITVHGGNVHLVDQMLLCRAILFCWFFGFKRILALFSWRYFFHVSVFTLFRSKHWHRPWLAQGRCSSLLVHSALHTSIYTDLCITSHNLFEISSLFLSKQPKENPFQTLTASSGVQVGCQLQFFLLAS